MITEKRAINIAISAIAEEIQQLAVAANLHDHYGLDVPHTKEASKRRKLLLEAVMVLQKTIGDA